MRQEPAGVQVFKGSVVEVVPQRGSSVWGSAMVNMGEVW
jgi:hypothetical protein